MRIPISLICVALVTTNCLADFIDFENVPGIPRPRPAVPGGYIPLSNNFPNIRFGPPDGTPGADAAVLTYRDDPISLSFGAFGPARSGDSAAYIFPQLTVFPFPSAPNVARPMGGTISMNFDNQPAQSISMWVLTSQNSTAFIANVLFIYTLNDGTQNFIPIPQATSGQWTFFQFTAPANNGLRFAGVSPALENNALSTRPIAMDDLTFTLVPTPAASVCLALSTVIALRRRRTV